MAGPRGSGGRNAHASAPSHQRVDSLCGIFCLEFTSCRAIAGAGVLLAAPVGSGHSSSLFEYFLRSCNVQVLAWVLSLHEGGGYSPCSCGTPPELDVKELANKCIDR